MSLIDQVYNRMNDDLEVVIPRKEESVVRKFYRGKTIFITGASGFMGKCLLEKLLRDCDDLQMIYVLMRKRSEATLEETLEKIFQDEIFKVLRKQNPHFEKKVKAMQGDLALDNLGLSVEDRQKLVEEVNIIFHNGATVKFNERVNVTLNVNVFGTKRMLDLAQSCKNLQVFMYVSSAYSHCYKKQIFEEFYQAPMDLRTLQDVMEADKSSANGLSEKALDQVLDKWPNVYVFSKALCEELVRQRVGDFKIAFGVYRPSMVFSTLREPLVGWNGNSNGPVMIFLAVGLGVLHTGPYKGEIVDIVPADFAINALLVTTWDLANNWYKDSRTVVYNFGSSVLNPCDLWNFYDPIRNHCGSECSEKAVYLNFYINTRNLFLFWVLHYILHFLPACLLDLYLVAVGKKAKAISLFLKVNKHIPKILYFGLGNWRIDSSNTIKIWDKLGPSDKHVFFYDIRQVDWRTTSYRYWRGLKHFILKEDINNPKCRKHYTRLWYLHHCLMCVFLLFFCFILMKFYKRLFGL